MTTFLEEFKAAYRGESIQEQAGYRCAGRIMLKQAVYALSLSANGRLIAFGGTHRHV
jgi:hypothetical protein